MTALDLFHPLVRDWFVERFKKPTEAQAAGWPQIAAGTNTLIAAPTGSGKTLAAFLYCTDRLLREAVEGELADGVQVVYVSPLKALSNDIHRNLEVPLAEIRALAESRGHQLADIRSVVRTGDTPQRERQSMLRRPPHILVTTPESLYLILTSAKAREILRTTRTVIVDEIHALARDKRGSHLALSLERLAHLCEKPPVRIGLSATQRPIEEIAQFLVGAGSGIKNRGSSTSANPQSAIPDPQSSFSIIDSGHLRQLDLAIEVPPSELAAVCSNEQWDEVYTRLVELIAAHRSTLVFVNTRRLAERVAMHLREQLGEDAVAAHHGSLSREIRLNAEQRLKAGELKAIVATASLEMGIDIGYIDLVCQIGSARSIATFLQRIGRSGHSLGAIPTGRLFPLTRDELIESLALIRAVGKGHLDRIEIPEAPLDILAQQIVAAVASDDWDEDELFTTLTRAWPYRRLPREKFDTIVRMLSEGITPKVKRGAYLHRDAIGRRLKPRRGARIAAVTSGGAIPETGDYRVLAEPERTFVGTINEDFAIESMAGDIFLLGNTSWRIRQVKNGEVIVHDAEGAAPTIPFWLGEAPGRTWELSQEVSALRAELDELLGTGAELEDPTRHAGGQQAIGMLMEHCGASQWAAEQAVRYAAAQKAALGLLPTAGRIVFERFFDEAGGMQLVIHAPLGSRINRAWGLALRKRFCRSFDFELQASADDDGIVLSLSPQHSFPIEQLFKMLNEQNARPLLEQALLAAPMFQTRWRWNLTRSLAVLRNQSGKKVPPFIQRMRSDDLLAAVFPDQVGCLENHHGDIPIPDHPLVAQTMHDCLHEAMDVDAWVDVLRSAASGQVALIARDTREPSPFSHELLNAYPYAFLDDAPLEERRARAVATRRTLSVDSVRDLAQLDPEAIAQVRSEAWPIVRDADELHDALLGLVVLKQSRAAEWQRWFEQLVADGRAAQVTVNGTALWFAAERWPWVRAVRPQAKCEQSLTLPPELEANPSASEAWVEMVRGWMPCVGPMTVDQLAGELLLEPSQVDAALSALEGEGSVLRGQFNTTTTTSEDAASPPREAEWCDRRLLARIHRRTLEGLRRQIQPVSPADYLRFLVRYHRVPDRLRLRGSDGVREVIERLQGFELAAGAWEESILPARVEEYDPEWLDQLSFSGELVWGRLRPPRRDEDEGPSSAPLTRVVPIALALREDLGWLLPADRASAETFARPNAAAVLEALDARGALFEADLRAITGLLPAHLEEALYELAALGLVTSDAFRAVRRLVGNDRTRRPRPRRRSPPRRAVSRAPSGRWSGFPGPVVECDADERLDRWVWQLLKRYGVLFRDLLTRETAAPAWQQLVPVLRRLELRGQLRGGRFVRDVAGEQYATPEAVDLLRAVRDEKPSGDWVVLSAADPLNLIGIVGAGKRIPALRTNTLVLRDGQLAAAQQSRQVEFFQPLSPKQQADMTRALRAGRKLHARTA